MTTGRRVALNSLVQLAGRGITMMVALGTLTLLARYLGPYRFGQYQLVIAFLMLVNISDLGVATIAVRHLSTGRREPEELMGNVLTVRALLALAATLLAIGAAFALHYPREIQIAIAVASLSFPLMIFSGAYNATFAANLRMEYAVAANVAQAVIGIAGMSAVVVVGGGLIPLLLVYDGAILVNSAVCLYFARRFVRPVVRFDRDYSVEVVREALPLGLATILIAMYGRIDIILLKALTDSESVGYYTFAYRAVDLAAPLSLMFIGSVYPLLSGYYTSGDHDEFKKLYQRSHDVMSLVGMLMLTGIMLFSRPIVEVVGGESYLPAVTSLQVLSMAFALIWLSNLVDHGLIAVGKQATLLWIALIGLGVNVGVNLMLIPIYGMEGAAAATVITEIVVLLPALVLLSRHLGEVPSFWVAGRLLPVVGVATVVVYALKLNWISEIVLTAALLSAGIALTRVVLLDDVRNFLRREPVEASKPAPAPVEVRP